MKRKLLSVLLCLSMAFSLSTQLILPAKAFGESDWVEASQVPDTAEITNRKWVYNKTTYVDSKEASLEGYEQVGFDWAVSSSGSKNYAAFPASPSQFDTSHWIYTSFHRSSSPPYTAYENATTKRTVSNSWGGYVYWHWMYDTDYANGYVERAIYDRKGQGVKWYYKFFGAFTSTNNYPSGGTGYCNNLGIKNYIVSDRTSWDLCQGATRWFRFEYNTCYYTDYYKLFHYKKVEQLETAEEITETSTSTEVISDVTEMVKFKNTFTISYDANGGTNAPAPQTKVYDVDLTLTSEVPKRDGYVFLGWDTTPAALAPGFEAGDTFVSNADATFYAIWRSATPCTVTYDCTANGGTSCSQYTTTGYLEQNADLTVTAHRDGWTFLGWGTSPEDTTPLESYTLTGDTTLYALFSRTISATFQYPSKWFLGANYGCLGILYNQDTEFLTALGEVKEIPGWTQVGWRQKSTGEILPLEGTVSISENDIFYAAYSKAVTLTYDANGGDTTPEPQTAELLYSADEKYEQEEPILAPAIEREGYTFDKWVTDGEEAVEYAPGDSIFLMEDTTVTASWTELPALEAPSILVDDTMTGKSARITGPEGADIYYTLDGSSPSEASALYTGEIPLNEAGTFTLKAIACQEGYNDSPVVIEPITLEQLSAPEADVADGYVKADALIRLENTAGIGEIRYTTDDSIPGVESPLYEAPLVMTETFTLTAAAYCPGYVPSEPVVCHYTLSPVYSVGTYGYIFSNVAESFGYNNTAPSLMKYCIPYSSVKFIFGDSVKGKSVYTNMTSNHWTGNCCGMASTSALMFSRDIPVSSTQFGKDTVHDLSIMDSAAELGDLAVLKFIEAMQISQYSAQFSQQYSGNRRYNADLANGYDLDQFYHAVKEDLEQEKNDIIAVGKSGVGAHALLAYRMEDVSDTESHLYIYDCNFPDDEERYITLTKNTQGHFVDWSYDMGGYGIWGTEKLGDGCYISYIPFDTVSFIWENRGRLFDSNLSLTVNKDNVAIYNYDQEVVAEIVDGRLVTDQEDIYEVPNLTLGENENGEQTIYLPEDYYYVQDLDAGSGDFRASIVGETLGVTVTTNAELVSLGINETEGVNQVAVDQASEEDYCTISLDSSYTDSNNETAFENITLSAVGTGQTVSVVNTVGKPMEGEDLEEDSTEQDRVEGDVIEGDSPELGIVVSPGIFDVVLGSPMVGAGSSSVTMTSPAGSTLSISNCTLGSCKINGEEKIKYEVKVTASEGGSVSTNGVNIPSGETIYMESGSDKTYVFQPAFGYTVADVLVDGQSVGALTQYTVEKISSRHTIRVIFEQGYGLEVPTVTSADRTVTAKVLSAEKASLLAVLYDGSGRMIDIKWIPVPAGTDGDLSAQFIRAIPADGGVKVFLLSVDGRPLCESRELEL